jgi:hypothetical protein
MKVIKKLHVIILVALVGCTNLQDAAPEQRNSFVHFYPGTVNTFCAASALDQDGGYVMIGFRSQSLTDLTNPSMVLTKTDARGKTLWEKVFTDPDGTTNLDSLYGKAIKPVADGYLVAADRIKVITDVNTNITTTTYLANFMKLDAQGNVVYRYETTNPNRNFLANSITTDELGKLIGLGTIIVGNNRLSALWIFSPASNGYALTFFEEFDLLTRNYTNGKSVQLTQSNNIIWASSITSNASGRSHAAFPMVVPGSTFRNFQQIGENDDINNIVVNDIQRNHFVFGAIGTNYTLSSGALSVNNNFFFARLANDGNIIPNSIKYYDGGVEVTHTDLASSTVEDAGLALTATQDGGYLLAGYLESQVAPTERGNGGKDILLVKVDPFGNVQWSKSFGGAGDEVVNTAIQSPDGGYIVTGTSIIQGFASMFMMKVNENGDLSN